MGKANVGAGSAPDAARLVVVGFEGLKMNSHAKRLIGLGVGGVILFARNYNDPAQVAELCRELKREAAPRPLLVMVDQEGGRVARLGPPFSLVPTPRTVGRTGDSKMAAAAGTILGRELRAVNIDVDLAPVADVDTNPKNPVIGDRAFGSDAERVGGMAAAFVSGLQGQGVAACAKHFPGHGDTVVDSHVALPASGHSLARLEEVELRPFRDVVRAGVACVMVGHIWAPALDDLGVQQGGSEAPSLPGPDSLSSSGVVAGGGAVESGLPLPATMCAGPIRYLRDKLGFQGAVITDDLEMGAIVKTWSAASAAVAAVACGADVVLVCHTRSVQEEVVEALRAAVASGMIPRSRLESACAAVESLCRAYCVSADGGALVSGGLDAVGCKEHKELIDEINQAAASMSL